MKIRFNKSSTNEWNDRGTKFAGGLSFVPFSFCQPLIPSPHFSLSFAPTPNRRHKGCECAPEKMGKRSVHYVALHPRHSRHSALDTRAGLRYVSRDAWILSAAIYLPTGFTTVDVFMTSRGAGTREKWSAE
jgi:hypothetical protein